MLSDTGFVQPSDTMKSNSAGAEQESTSRRLPVGHSLLGLVSVGASLNHLQIRSFSCIVHVMDCFASNDVVRAEHLNRKGEIKRKDLRNYPRLVPARRVSRNESSKSCVTSLPRAHGFINQPSIFELLVALF